MNEDIGTKLIQSLSLSNIESLLPPVSMPSHIDLPHLPPSLPFCLPPYFSLSNLCSCTKQIRAVVCGHDTSRVLVPGVLATVGVVGVAGVTLRVARGHWGQGPGVSKSEMELDQKLMNTLYASDPLTLGPLCARAVGGRSLEHDVRAMGGDHVGIGAEEGPLTSLTLMQRRLVNVTRQLRESQSHVSLLESELTVYKSRLAGLARDVETEREGRMHAEMRVSLMQTEQEEVTRARHDLEVKTDHVARLEEMLRGKEEQHQRLLQDHVIIPRAAAQSRDKAFSDMQRRVVALEAQLKVQATRESRAVTSKTVSNKSKGQVLPLAPHLRRLMNVDADSLNTNSDTHLTMTSDLQTAKISNPRPGTLPASGASVLHRRTVRSEVNEYKSSNNVGATRGLSRKLSNISEHELECEPDVSRDKCEKFFTHTVCKRQTTHTSQQHTTHVSDQHTTHTTAKKFEHKTTDTPIIQKLRELLHGHMYSRDRGITGNPAQLTSQECKDPRWRVYKQTSPAVSVEVRGERDTDTDSGEFLSASAIFPSINASPRSDVTDVTTSVAQDDTTPMLNPLPQSVAPGSCDSHMSCDNFESCDKTRMCDNERSCGILRTSDFSANPYEEKVCLEPHRQKVDYIRYTSACDHYPLNH